MRDERVNKLERYILVNFNTDEYVYISDFTERTLALRALKEKGSYRSFCVIDKVANIRIYYGAGLPMHHVFAHDDRHLYSMIEPEFYSWRMADDNRTFINSLTFPYVKK